jgi:Ca2+-binding EF-hand superfamily protein
MLLALGVASSAIDALQSLTSPKPSSALAGGFSQDAANLFDLGNSAASAGSTAAAGGSGFSQISPATMSALISAQGQSSAGSTAETPVQALQDLFSQIDANGDGQISESEFENALGAGGTNIAQADDVFAKLDKDGNGSISLGEMSSALKGGPGAEGSNGTAGAGSSTGTSTSGASDPLAQALQAASTTSVTNSDGSTTTSLTFPDGAKVTMPAAGTTAGAATSSYNSVEQMIARATHAISFSAVPALSLNA